MFRAWWVFLLWIPVGCVGAPETLRGTTADGSVWFAQMDGDEAVVVECRPEGQPRCVRYAPARVSQAQYQAWRRAAGAAMNGGAITAASAKVQYEAGVPVPIPPTRTVPGGVI